MPSSIDFTSITPSFDSSMLIYSYFGVSRSAIKCTGINKTTQRLNHEVIRCMPYCSTRSVFGTNYFDTVDSPIVASVTIGGLVSTSST